MIVSNIKKFVLELPKLAIELRVDLEQSVYDTIYYQPQPNTDFVFAAGEIWVSVGSKEDMVTSSLGAGNLIEILNFISAALCEPKDCPELEQKIIRGGICKWKLGYWDRIMDDSCTQDDESTYDLLHHLCILAENRGCLAIYAHNNEAIIDVTGQGYGGAQVLHAWSVFDPDTAANSAYKLKNEICMAVLREKKERGEKGE